MAELATFCARCGARLPVPGEPCTAGCREDICPFCERIKGGRYGVGNGDAVAFEPLDPVTDGHLLVVPRRHVADAFEDPEVTAETMRAAASIARDQYRSVNLITSAGAPATQTIRHLHIHIVPRREGDDLALPWTRQAPLRLQQAARH